ncbi:MAG: penicillin-binding protein 2 [Acidobacteriota bacterium]|nr:penicillin-binding protein 2 [Acidobacteriota bacterium]
MALEQDASRQLIQKRFGRFRIPVLLIFLVFGARLWQLQIIQGAEYTLKAERNRVRRIQIVAPRGAIFDRNGALLVENRPSFDVFLYREDMKDREATTRFIVEKLGVPQEDLERQFSRHKNTPKYRPIVVKEDVGMEDISVVEAYRRDHPEIRLGREHRRLYNYGTLAAHLLGYMGEVSEKELKSGRFPNAVAGSLVGQTGVEKTYNHILMGIDGARQVLVNSVGREVDVLDEIPAIIGGEIRLSLDLDLQMVAEQELEGRVGVVIAMDPRNGEILTMASAPSFDPNAFSPRISSMEWKELLSNPDKPLQNRAIQNSESPGSIFKVMLASAGLHSGALDDNPAVQCVGASEYYGRPFRCASQAGHGYLRLEQAIASSCNIFFYELGRKLGISKIAEHSLLLGLGSRTGIDLPDERNGVVPSPEWSQRVRKQPWYPGETISVAIGQGAVNAPPIQILRAIGAIASGGRLTTPHVLLGVETGDRQNIEWPVTRLPLKDEHISRIKEGMWQSVNGGGTGRGAMVAGMDICGKTGTVQVVGRENRQFMRSNSENHSWFAGFADRDNPEIAVVVFVEHGGSGGAVAAPIAGKIFKAYYEKKHPQQKPPENKSGAAKPVLIADAPAEEAL